MRYKISFQKNEDKQAALPLHHQHLLSAWLHQIAGEIDFEKECVTFSSLKGTTRIMNGKLKYLSSKISLAVSSSDPSVAETLSAKIMEQSTAQFESMKMFPKKAEAVITPTFSNKVKYVCISPIILSNKSIAGADQKPVDPSSHEFSDKIFNALMDRMEKAGYTQKQLDEYQVFGITPDKEYLAKAQAASRKIGRPYKDNSGNEYLGYLFPFTLHAHPDVQRFVWDCGLGRLTFEGYGMIDLAEVQ